MPASSEVRKKNGVGRAGLQFRRIFQDQQTVMRAKFVQLMNDGIHECRLAAGGSAHHNDIFPVQNGGTDNRRHFRRYYSLRQEFLHGDDP